jgi:hypothetical protein
MARDEEEVDFGGISRRQLNTASGEVYCAYGLDMGSSSSSFALRSGSWRRTAKLERAL